MTRPQVERFGPNGDQMCRHANGQWVRYGDFLAHLAALEAERDAEKDYAADAAARVLKAELAQRKAESRLAAAVGLLKRVDASMYLLDRPHREFGGITDRTERDIRTFLASAGTGGNANGRT